MLLSVLASPRGPEAATYRDELTFLGRTSFLFREYTLVVPVDVKRQPLPTEVFLEIKDWGAWNGSWIPYVYEPVDVPGARPEDLNDIIVRYRKSTKDPRIDIRKAPDNAFVLTYAKAKTRFDLRAKGFAPRVVVENPEGWLALGVTDGDLNVNGHAVTGRVACVVITPGKNGDATGRYGLYDHFTLQLPSGAILVVYHSRNRPGFNLAALLTPDGKGNRQGRAVQVAWRRPWSDAASGREVPTAWTVEAAELGLTAGLEEWGRNAVRYRTDVGKMAIVVNAMVRGSVEIAGARTQAYALNVHVQDE